MARLTGDNIKQYKASSGSGSYFSLKEDKETAKIRFLYESASDIEGFVVHKVTVGDRDRYVNCLEDGCPFCEAKLKKSVKLFIPIYNEKTGQIQIWERGQKYYGKISGLCSRYPNIVSRVFEIERNGKPKDTNTTYNEYPIGDADGTTVQDILDDCGVEELVNPLGTIILDKSVSEMEHYLDYGDFPKTDSNNDVPMRRRGRGSEPEDLPFEKDEQPTRSEERQSRRSTRGNRDRF